MPIQICLLLATLPVVLFLPGLACAMVVRRACGLNGASTCLFSIVFSFALVPLFLYDVSYFLPLRNSGSFAVAFACLVLPLLGIAAWLHGRARREPASPGQEHILAFRNWKALLPLLLAVALCCYLPFARHGTQDGAVVRLAWPFDWYFAQAIVNSMVRFGLPCKNIFIATNSPHTYHFYAMILKAMIVHLSNGLLNPVGVSVIVNIASSCLFVLSLVFIFGLRFGGKSTAFALSFILLFPCFDFIAHFVRRGAPSDLLFCHSKYLLDAWAEISWLRVFSPYGYMVFQPRHLMAAVFFLMVLFLLGRRSAGPVTLGVLTGCLMASMIGYSIPLALNSVLVLVPVFAWAFVEDLSHRRLRRCFWPFSLCASLTGLVLGLPFILSYLGSTGEGTVTSRLVLNRAETETWIAFFLVDFGALILLGPIGACWCLAKRRVTSFDTIMAIATVVTAGLAFGTRKMLGDAYHNNDFGMKTTILVFVGLAYFAAHLHAHGFSAIRHKGLLARQSCRCGLYATSLLALLVAWMCCPISAVWFAFLAIFCGIVEWLLWQEVLVPFRGLVVLLVAMCLGFINLVCDIRGYLNIGETRATDKYACLMWLRNTSRPDAMIQQLPIYEGVAHNTREMDVMVLAQRRTYVSRMFFGHRNFKPHLAKLHRLTTASTPWYQWVLARQCGIDYLLVQKGAALALPPSCPYFECVFEAGKWSVLRVVPPAEEPR